MDGGPYPAADVSEEEAARRIVTQPGLLARLKATCVWLGNVAERLRDEGSEGIPDELDRVATDVYRLVDRVEPVEPARDEGRKT